MTRKTLFLVGLALSVCLASPASSRKKKTSKKEPQVERLQPVPADSFSYAMGLAQSASLKQYLVQREGVDTAYLNDVVCGMIAGFNEKAAKGKIAYAAGLKIAQMNTAALPSLNQVATGKKDTTYIDRKLFEKGLSEGLLHQSSGLTQQEAIALIERQSAFVRQQDSLRNMAYLEANKEAEGVVTLPSGLQYRILKKGTGALPTDTSQVEVNYEGRLIDGTVCDSSYQRGKPATFACNQVIKGWTEALQLMPVGSTWELFIPYNLAYGERGNQGIPPFSTLIFKVELLNIVK